MRAGLFSQFVDHASAGFAWARAELSSVAHEADGAVIHEVIPTGDAAAGHAALEHVVTEPVLPPEQLIHDLDYAGRPSTRATGAMQELVTREVRAAVTTQDEATRRYLEISGRGIDQLTPDDLRQIHALLDELPSDLRVPQPPGVEPASIARAASNSEIYPTGQSWHLGDGPRRIVATRAFHQLPDEAATLTRLRTLVDIAEPTRDNIREIEYILDGLPEDRVPQVVRDAPERAEAARRIGWVANEHDGVASGFSIHQEAGQLLFAIRNRVSGNDEQALLRQLDGLLDTPLTDWRASHVRELSNLLKHPDMPRPDVRLGWDLPEVLKQLNWAATPYAAPFDASGNGTLNLIYTDLRVARSERLGVMANRTHELAGRIVEGTVTKPELQEFRMIAEREPTLAAALPEWMRSPDHDYRDITDMLRIDRNHDELRNALLPMIDATEPTNELLRLTQLPTLTDDEAIRMVRVAGRIDAFDLPLPEAALARIPRAIEQALLSSGPDPVVSRVAGQLAERHGWKLEGDLSTIAEARRIVALLNTPGSMAPHRSNSQQSVRESIALVDRLLEPASDIHPQLRGLLTDTRDILARHSQRLSPGAGQVANQNGVAGYLGHADYSEIGRAASNIELGTELLSASTKAKTADTLAW